MFYAAMSYWFHTDRPADLTAAMRELQERYSPFPYIDGTHMFASFGHLAGYSSAYYTYMWSLVIAKDLFSAFDPADLFEPTVAGRYRDLVLAPGGSKDAADLVADFLGRPVHLRRVRRLAGAVAGCRSPGSPGKPPCPQRPRRRTGHDISRTVAILRHREES